MNKELKIVLTLLGIQAFSFFILPDRFDYIGYLCMIGILGLSILAHLEWVDLVSKTIVHLLEEIDKLKRKRLGGK